MQSNFICHISLFHIYMKLAYALSFRLLHQNVNEKTIFATLSGVRENVRVSVGGKNIHIHPPKAIAIQMSEYQMQQQW